jgi:1-deoxy-D-xylulose-5-phosphate reductoisomerase
MVVGAMVGAAGLKPTLAAIQAGKNIALANKETLVMAGALVMSALSSNKVRLLPVDSEHSAIFQCLQGNRRQDLDKVILTGSGGPFRTTAFENFTSITPSQALRHPNWQMGAKITIDSATMMNKGLEVIEAKWLFDLECDQIEVVIHPQSIVHSMVAYKDGSIMAQLGVPDMQTAIAFALSFPQRLPLKQPFPDLVSLQALTFESPDFKRFPCLALAFEACRSGGTLPVVLNAANEIAVEAFLAGQLSFLGIPIVIEHAMAAHTVQKKPDLQQILAADRWARKTAKIKVEANAKI